ncbi:hypothetical protein FDA94_04965 [Herbidospora galbida]|uniref:Uncharacterized protein n=1 Tax=Herbidospora galbida TaxID=2575442 RepID=A0A4U3MMY7_9ACTN|nr:hypothetical protein [Herbidospora galbida]TKK90360.1 hypothetical protein FDA94_04965 [Herbidospora galbida]
MNGQPSACDHHSPPPAFCVEPEQVHWRPAQSAERFARKPHVIAWTCDCQPIVYEQLMAGGSYLIRRTDQSDHLNVVQLETAPTDRKEADALWRRIMSGTAV